MTDAFRTSRSRSGLETPAGPLWLRLAAPMLILAGCSPGQAPPPASGGPGSDTPPPSSSTPPPAPAPDVVPPGSSGEPYAASRTYTLSNGVAGQAWIICDGVDVGSLYVVGLPDAAHSVSVASYSKTSLGDPTRQSFTLGAPDPGAGQVFWPLTGPGAVEAGNLHAINPGVLTSPADAFTPTFTSMKVGPVQASCRWLARTRFMGFSGRRTFVITQADDRTLTYQTFDFKDAASAKPANPDGAQRSTTPTLQIVGGKEVAGGFTFENSGYDYQVAAGRTGATVAVLKGGQQVQRETLTAWTIAPAP